MSKRRAKNKLSIYLLKEGYSNKFLKDDSGLTDHDNGIYTANTPDNSPKWVKNFFITEELDLTTKSVAALYKTEITLTVDTKDTITRHFVICFGTGFHKLNSDSIEKRFGLKTALSMGEINQIRALNKKDISGTPKISQEQLANLSPINSFGVDIQQDILQGITISLDQDKFTKEKYGKTLSGKDSLTITVSNDMTNIQELLSSLYNYYVGESYKTKGYDWIDHIAPIKTPNEVSKLELALLEKIKNDKIDLNLAPPELIDWDNFEGFSKENTSVENVEIFDEIDLKNFVPEDTLKNISSVQEFKDIRVNLVSSEENSIKNSWKFFDCINSEINIFDRKFILTDGNWYEVENNYLLELENWWNNLDIQVSSLPEYAKTNGKHSEAKYNESQNVTYEVLDRKCVNLPHQSGIEICDLYEGGRFIHIKIFRSSSDLSHLMAQALVSSNLFLGSKEFRKEINKKLKSKLTADQIQKPTRSRYEVVLAIISNKDEFDLPFFTKINLRTNINHIQMLDLKCTLEVIKGNY